MVLLALWHVDCNLASFYKNLNLISHRFDIAKEMTLNQEILKLLGDSLTVTYWKLREVFSLRQQLKSQNCRAY